ncbi:MAG TPA: helix-turn-helix domain-containing protein [Pseudonocardia sp.]|nr:helix-turn-helix domain-containing protein [Pseudonocardia sp.]
MATERKLTGLTQLQLAQRAHVSVSLVRSVEQGRVPASPAFVAAVARALGRGTPELLGQPAGPRTPDDRRTHTIVPALRRELASYQLPGDEGIEVRPVEELRHAVRGVSARRQSVDLARLGEEVPALLAELRAFTSSTGSEEGYGLLALAWTAAGQVTYKLGYADLSSLCTERIEWAAARSGDELAVAAGAFFRAGELIVTNESRAALDYLDRARSQIEHRLDDEAGRSMYGQLHLKSGLAAARAGDGATVDSHLAEAKDLASRVGEFRNDYELCFNVHNVRIWSVGLAVELMEGTKAVERAQGMVIPRGVSLERAGHHFIDLSRGYLLHGDKAGAFESLLTARRIAPQQTKYHPQVHETVRMLAQAERRRSDSLGSFVSWLGVTV